jgi:carbon storage regulator
MLVLTRKQQEKIRIGDQITITVLRTKGKAVRLGIEAPADVPVIRGELTFQIKGEAEVVVDACATAEDVDVPKAVALDVARATVPAGRKGPEWSPKTEPVATSNRLPGAGASVSLQRISREQVAQALPGVAEGVSPLRAMLKRRTLSA